jgi:hypothetical protein
MIDLKNNFNLIDIFCYVIMENWAAPALPAIFENYFDKLYHMTA